MGGDSWQNTARGTHEEVEVKVSTAASRPVMAKMRGVTPDDVGNDLMKAFLNS